MKLSPKRVLLECLIAALILAIYGYVGQSDYENQMRSHAVDLPRWEGQ